MGERHLFDPFRSKYPHLRRYTWRRKNPLKQARQTLHSYANNCKIEPCIYSDHSIVTLELQFNNFVHGKGLWKHTNSLLTDKIYIDTINSKIDETKLQYALPVYNLENVTKIPNSEIQFSISDQLFLETLLMELRGKSVSYSSHSKKSKK